MLEKYFSTFFLRNEGEILHLVFYSNQILNLVSYFSFDYLSRIHFRNGLELKQILIKEAAFSMYGTVFIISESSSFSDQKCIIDIFKN